MLCLNWTPITFKLIFFKKEFPIGFIDEKSSENFHQKKKKKNCLVHNVKKAVTRTLRQR